MSYVYATLAHHGVKGMHWGVHRSVRSTPSRPQAVKVVAPPGKRVKTSGGGGHGISKEAKATAATNQKAKASKVHSLSNKELEAAVKRMRLEQQYSELASQRTTIGRGKAFFKGAKSANSNLDQVAKFGSSPAGKELKKSFAKKATKVAVLAAI